MSPLRLTLIAALALGSAHAADSLKDAAAKRGIRIGAAVQSGFLANEPAYTDTFTREFSMLEPEYEMLWSTIHPGPSSYNFSGADKLMAFAAAHDMPVRADHLVWHSSLPSWLTGGNYNATQLNSILKDHITAVAGRYAGKVYSWEVVNEAVDPSGTKLRDSIWNNQPGIGLTGVAWIEQAFRWAHDADPQALLFYNDYGAEDSNTKSDFIYNMVKQMLADGTPIHGVGLQMHLTNNANYPSASGLAANIKRLTDLGMLVIITEMDVRLPVDANGNASASDLAIQAQLYGRVSSTCIQLAGCVGIQTWGVGDKHSWVPGTFPGTGAALAFDVNYQPKAAYNSLLNPLVTTPPVISANALTNAASYAVGAVAPGEIVTLFGANFGPPSLLQLQLDATGKIATSLGGAQLLFDGVAAPVVYSVTGQSSFIVPFEVAGKANTQVQYVYQGAHSNTVTVPVVAVAPALFSIDTSGSGPGAIQDANYNLNSATNPAKAGDVVLLYATGAGVLTPAAQSGALASAPLPKPAAQVSVQIGGKDAQVQYAGTASGLTNALLQVNVVIPAGLSPGPQPVVLQVGGVASSASVTVAVR
jgi:endo-1,4-beta-xylanase